MAASPRQYETELHGQHVQVTVLPPGDAKGASHQFADHVRCKTYKRIREPQERYKSLKKMRIPKHADRRISRVDWLHSRNERHPAGASGEFTSGAQEALGNQRGEGQTCMTSQDVEMVSPGAVDDGMKAPRTLGFINRPGTHTASKGASPAPEESATRTTPRAQRKRAETTRGTYMASYELRI